MWVNGDASCESAKGAYRVRWRPLAWITSRHIMPVRGPINAACLLRSTKRAANDQDTVGSAVLAACKHRFIDAQSVVDALVYHVMETSQ